MSLAKRPTTWRDLPRGWAVSLVFLVHPATVHPATGPAADTTRGPNVLIILADDLGFSDLGCYGGEIATPHLDSLAAGGLRFTQFYNTARCWPTRAALLTGYYAQQVRRDTLPNRRSGAGGQRPTWAKLLPERLQTGGYRCYHSGKWHLDGMPLATGFQRSYYLQDQGRFFHPRGHFEDDVRLPAVEPGGDFYATTAIADHAIRCLQDHARQSPQQPFFHYLAFTAPHFPLQALPADIARYAGVYQRGWDVVRQARWQRIEQLGLVTGKLSEVEHTIGPPYDFPQALETLGPGELNRPRPWIELTAAQQRFQADKMTIHAAMVDRLDQEVGRVLQQLRQMHAWDNTLILFLSDNGASAEIMVRDDGHDPRAEPGSAATYLCLGPGWSTTCNTPFRRHKTWVHEGGIATPLIAHWPQGLSAHGQLRHQPGHVVDIVPTILELAYGPRPQQDTPADAPPAPGSSLLAAMRDQQLPPREPLWWLHEGNRALRAGPWKLVAARGDPWELYDLSSDRTETTDLAAKFPAKVQELAGAWSERFDQFCALAAADLPDQPEQVPAEPAKHLILPGESFLLAGRAAFVLLPPVDRRSTPQPWICYAPTLPGYPDEHERWMHRQFLHAGVAVAGIDVGEAYGSPQGRQGFDDLYQFLVSERGFARRPCLLGRSRGGLWVTSWAIQHPEKVAGIAGIYPVFDLRSYPGLETAAPAYGLDVARLSESLPQHNPIENCDVLARAQVPVFLIHGDQDTVVPIEANSAELARRYTRAGAAAHVHLVVAAAQGHNLWPGFFRNQALIEFAIARARAGAGHAETAPEHPPRESKDP